jgi:hypothetical protein
MSQSKLGHEVSAETRAKISKALLGQKKSKATRKKMSMSHIGKHHSADTKELISDTLKLRRMLVGHKPMTPERLKKHKAMLRKKKPWLNANSQRALREGISSRKERAAIKRAMAE